MSFRSLLFGIFWRRNQTRSFAARNRLANWLHRSEPMDYASVQRAVDRWHRGCRRLDNLVLGVFEGVPTTQKSVFEVATGPDRILLYQKNIEAVCSSEDEIRREIRLTVIHELGHYFGMTEAQLEGI